jgi:hypothetical protein
MTPKKLFGDFGTEAVIAEEVTHRKATENTVVSK